jgi:hypothetical protein
MAAIGMKRSKAASQITLRDGPRYVVGDNAWKVGEPIGGMDYGALASEARKALFYGGLSDLLQPGSYQADLVIGLPVPLLQAEDEARTVLHALKDGYKGLHEWQAGQSFYQLEINRLTVLAQPVGAYADWLIDGDLHQRKGARAAEVAVLDIGMNTLDLYVIQGGAVVDRFVGGAKVGVRRLLATMNGHGQDLEELDFGLRTGTVRPAAGSVRAWLGEVLGQIERAWPNPKRFTAVIPAGGGACVLGDQLRKALEDRGAHVEWPEDPVSTNARGLWKWAASAARK